eukprot:TRINITY_DN6916_c0_g1_i1.p2 TRINITY_DN6916_c0_g1~~TRINITY_DN6916_c0_g1_i1.p2  ORF type:complete len:295 (+),score=37.95 TRINITY_DN6916_c0_g1_i1:84-968(+)
MSKPENEFVQAIKEKSIRTAFRLLKQHRFRRPDLVVSHAYQLLRSGSDLTELELWDLTEQVFIAAIDVRDDLLSKDLMARMRAKFGHKSLRVRRLAGMQLEASRNFSEAEQIYADILKEDPANSFVMKRQIAIRKAVGDLPAAVKALNEYLKIFMADSDAWQELAELYIEQQNHKLAAFCYEELIMAAPQNFHLYSKYGEIRYTMGGYENLKIARKYFAQAVEMSGTKHVRSLLCLCMAAKAVAACKQGKADKENIDIHAWAFEKLKLLNAAHPNNLDLLGPIGVLDGAGHADE